jgi:hypothetical protein
VQAHKFHRLRWLSYTAIAVGLHALSGCDAWLSSYEASGPELEVFEDRYRFRGQDYRSERTLNVAIIAAGESPASVNVRECVDQSRIVTLIELLRQHGREDVYFLFPEQC